MSKLQLHHTSTEAPLSRVNRWSIPHILILLGFWLAIYATSLATPPLLDDADATHAQAAQAIVNTGDWVTLHVDGIRYLEKAPLPYWLAAVSLRIFGANAFAIHLPEALAILALALLGYTWSRRTFDAKAALYTGIFTLTATGTFLFTRIFIPDALLSLFVALALYALLDALETSRPSSAYLMWIALALAVLTKGLVAIVFIFGTALIFLIVTKDIYSLRKLHLFRGLLLFLLIAAPWHIMAGLRNTHGANGHGFFWFYFVNEHFLRYLGQRIPRDYNKLPTALYWSLHLIWLFPWSLFAPAALLCAFRRRREIQATNDLDATGQRLSRLELIRRPKPPIASTYAQRTVLLLAIFSAFVLIFFSFSTNQEYYTFPVYLPLLMLLAAAISAAEHRGQDISLKRALTFAHATFTLIGLAIAAALAFGLYTSRNLPFTADIGSLLAHRGVGDYTLSLSHFFDLTGPSFAALRLPAAIALLAFTIGPAAAWFLRARRHPLASTLTIATTSAAFLIAAHIALVRFSPMLSSQPFAIYIQQQHLGDSEILIYGDQAFGSSLPFYLNRQVSLVDGRSTSLLFGSTFPDVPPIFLTPQQLLAQWATGPRKLLFVPAERRDDASKLLGRNAILLKELSGKALLTDRPLNPVDITPSTTDHQGNTK